MRFSNSTKLKMTESAMNFFTQRPVIWEDKQSKLVREDYLKIEECKINGMYSGLVPVLC